VRKLLKRKNLMFEKTTARPSVFRDLFPGDQFSLARMKNIRNAAEGSNLPPRYVGGTRVPSVTGLKLIRALTFAAGDHIQYTIKWNDINLPNIDHYSIYVTNNADPVGTSSSPYQVKNSPATLNIIIPPNTISKSIILVQTVLNNGFTSDIKNSPSITAGFINFP
jgi:hypothetical protein